jgi:hypothetical protein
LTPPGSGGNAMKYLLFLTLVVSFARAAMISTSATCDGVATVGTFSANCNGGSGSSAGANVTSTGPFFDVGAHAQSLFTGSASATATFSDIYFFTVSGGTGKGSFYPCFVAGGNHAAMEDGFFDGISVSFDGSNASNCFGDGSGLFPFSKPLTFSVPQVVGLALTASAVAGFASAGSGLSLHTILIFDASGKLQPDATYTLVSTSVPESSCLSLLSVGLIFLLAMLMFWHPFSETELADHQKRFRA